MQQHRNLQRGGITVVALVLAFLASFGAMAIIRHTYDMRQITERAVALERAMTYTESGLYEILHYFNFHDQIPDELAKGNVQDFFSQYYYDKDHKNYGIDETIDTSALIGINGNISTVFIDRENGLNEGLIIFDGHKGELIELRVTAPPMNSNAWMTFHSTAEARSANGRHTVTWTSSMDVLYPVTTLGDNFFFPIPAAIIAGGNAGSTGQFNLLWGEAWSLGDMKIPRQKYTKPTDDAWVSYRAVGNILNDAGSILRKTDSDVYNFGSEGFSEGDRHYDSLLAVRDHNGVPVMQQNNPPMIMNQEDKTIRLADRIEAVLDMFRKEEQYDFLKKQAINHGTYFRYIGSGKVTTSITDTNISAENTMSVRQAINLYRILDMYYNKPNIVFFDTTNGKYPLKDGSNWADITLSGNIDDTSKGILYVAGNLNIQGSGNQPLYNIHKPPLPNVTVESKASWLKISGSPELKKIMHEGIIYTHGDYTYRGQSVIYGSVITNGVYDAGGTPNVYYNYGLRYGFPSIGIPVSEYRVHIVAKNI